MVLDDKQKSEYLGLLGFDIEPAPTKAALDELVFTHQKTIPFSTMDVGVGPNPPNTNIDALYDKIILNRKGGYCFELNKLFQELIQSLGFTARSALSRSVRGREERMPINHRGLLVELDEGLAFVDVGFGGPTPSASLVLVSGEKQDIRGSIFIAEKIDPCWWKIDRITKAGKDLHDDNVPSRRQTELEICTANVEDIDFDSLNVMCSRPGTLFHDHEILNLKTQNGHKGYRDGILTIRENGNKQVIELTGEVAKRNALLEHFGYQYL